MEPLRQLLVQRAPTRTRRTGSVRRSAPGSSTAPTDQPRRTAPPATRSAPGRPGGARTHAARPRRPSRRAWRLSPALGRDHRHDPRVRLLEDPRRRGHEGRLHDRRIVDNLVDPPVDRRGETDLALYGDQHLTEHVRQRQPQELQVIRTEHPDPLDRGALVGPHRVRQPHTLGTTGRAGRVDQRAEVIRLDLRQPLVDRGGMLSLIRITHRVQRGQADDPIPVALQRRAVDQHDLVQRRRLGPMLAQFVDLPRVFGEHDPYVGIRDDERDVRRHRRGVDRGRRGGGQYGGQIAVDPLHPGAGRDPDPLLRLDAERDQAGCPAARQLLGLAPGDGFPLIPGRIPERLALRGRGDAVQEHLGHRVLAVAEQGELAGIGDRLHNWPPSGVK